jgi:hypothetical protein
MKSSLWKILFAAVPVSGMCAEFGLPWGAEYIVNAPGFHTAAVVRDGSQRVGALGSITNGTKTAAGVSFLGNGGLWAQSPFVITNEFSVGVWFNTSVNSNMTLFGANMGAGQSVAELALGDSGAGGGTNAYFSAADTNRPNTDFVRVAVNPRDGVDHLLVATMDSSAVRIYLDGVEQAQTARTANSSGRINLTNAPTWAAFNQFSAGTFIRRYSGEIGAGAYWFRALASNEVRRWYMDGIGLEAMR